MIQDRVATVIALACGLGLAAVSARAQEPAQTLQPPVVHGRQSVPAPAGKPPAVPTELEVYTARHVKAAELARVLTELFGRSRAQLKMTTDDSRNAIIVSGSAEDLRTVAELIRKLDVDSPRRNPDARELRIFALKNLQPDQKLNEVLKMVFSGEGRYALDPQRKHVIAYADRTTLDTADAVLMRLDEMVVKPRLPAEMQIRIVWLASGLSPKDAPKPPEDLADVVAELAKIGLNDPRLVSQTMVNAVSEREFNVQGSAKLDAPCQLVINGTITNAAPGDPAGLQISIIATQLNPKGDGTRAQVCKLETSIYAPPRHAVVLGLTPTETVTSVFVVQLLPKKTSSGGPAQ
jgi:hypothetical protein